MSDPKKSKPRNSAKSDGAFRLQLARVKKEAGDVSAAMSISVCTCPKTAVSLLSGNKVMKSDGMKYVVGRWHCGHRFCPPCTTWKSTKQLPYLTKLVRQSFENPALMVVLTIPLNDDPLSLVLNRAKQGLGRLAKNRRFKELCPRGFIGFHQLPRKRREGWNVHIHLLVDAPPTILTDLHELWAEALGLDITTLKAPEVSTDADTLAKGIRYVRNPIDRLHRFDREKIMELLEASRGMRLFRVYGFSHEQTRAARAATKKEVREFAGVDSVTGELVEPADLVWRKNQRRQTKTMMWLEFWEVFSMPCESYGSGRG